MELYKIIINFEKLISNYHHVFLHEIHLLDIYTNLDLYFLMKN